MSVKAAADATRSGRLSPGSSLVLQAAGGLSAALGLTVLAGWDIPAIISVPLLSHWTRLSMMTGLCLSGMGLLAAGRGNRILSLYCGALTLAVGVGGIAGQVAAAGGEGLGVLPSGSEAAFPRAFVRTGPLAVALLGISSLLLTWAPRRRLAPGLIGSVVGSWGGAALVGALAGFGAPHPSLMWQLAGGLGFLIAGVGSVVWNWQMLRGQRGPRLSVAPALVGVAILTATLYFWDALRALERAHVVRTMDLAATHVRADVTGEIESRVLALVRMVRRWEARGEPPRQEWESDASMYLAHYSGYYALAWIDASGSVRWTVRQNPSFEFPLRDPKGYTAAALALARQSRQPVLSRSIDLGAAGRAVLICLPLYRQGAFEGFIAGVFRLEVLLDSIFNNVNVGDYSVSVSDRGETVYSRAVAEAADAQWGRRMAVDLYSAAWTVQIWPKARLLANQDSFLPFLALAAGFLLAGLSSLATKLALTASRRAGEADAVNQELHREVAERRRAQEELARARDELEIRVAARTAELARINDDLTAEIVERNRAEETVRAGEQRYRELFDAANDIIYVHDLKGNFLAMNKAAQRISGYSLEEGLGLNLENMVAPEDIEQARSMIASKLGGDHTMTYELTFLAKDGRRARLELNTHLIYRDGRPVAVQGIGRDITERKRLEEQLRQSQKMEAVGRLAGGIAHDFNNLLTVIGAYSQMLKEGMPEEERLQGYAQEIIWAAERASGLTNRLLAFSRRQVVQPKLLELNDLVLAMDNMLRRLIGEDIELITSLQPGLARFKADPSQVEQVVMNLAVNARDAIETGGRITITTANAALGPEEIRALPSLDPGPHVVLSVSDTGVGMDAEVRSHLFEPFFTTKETGKGTGLGLSTVYGIVKQCGGDIAVESIVGKGSTFSVYFPAVEEPHVLEPGLSRASGDKFHGERETILLVEDEQGVRKLVRRMLLQNAYRVLEAGDGPAAVRIAEEYDGAIDVLLTDVVMPKMSGRELAERLSARYPGMKVLYMTGYTEDAILRHGVSEQTLSVLKKPFRADDLARKLREVLESRPQAET